MVVLTPLPLQHLQVRSTYSFMCWGQRWWCAASGMSCRAGCLAGDVSACKFLLGEVGETWSRSLTCLWLSKDQWNQTEGFKSGCFLLSSCGSLALPGESRAGFWGRKKLSIDAGVSLVGWNCFECFRLTFDIATRITVIIALQLLCHR